MHILSMLLSSILYYKCTWLLQHVADYSAGNKPCKGPPDTSSACTAQPSSEENV